MFSCTRKIATWLLAAAMITALGGCARPIEVSEGEGRVKVKDIDVSYRVVGNGYPLVLIMGYGSTMNLWETGLVRELATRFKVVTFDNRGMGNTTAGAREFSIEQFADDTSGLMQALGLSQAHVLGWSMGSMIAQELALRHPSQVNRLILYATYSDSRMFPPTTDVINRITDTSGTPQERGMRFISVLFPGSWLRANGERIKEIFFRPMGNSPPETLGKQSLAIDRWKGSSERLGEIHKPTLIITGTDDVLVVPKNALYMKEKIAGAQLGLIEHGGHGLMFQYPDQFAQIINNFLK